jgi:hypothetical protein
MMKPRCKRCVSESCICCNNMCCICQNLQSCVVHCTLLLELLQSCLWQYFSVRLLPALGVDLERQRISCMQLNRAAAVLSCNPIAKPLELWAVKRLEDNERVGSSNRLYARKVMLSVLQSIAAEHMPGLVQCEV